ncbi:YciI family protein [Tabrizicola sp.]|uniref:YciI family protein n=1 Tax=Tabrizicola sp. TaxID=2005166 RepID=UPI002622749B|nr:YciI family protein [Tabrizicola sp.]MDM7931783.1 YciI family protein [Tabrizicola sp.]
MRFALVCLDKPNALQTRVENRAAHLAHIEASGVVEQAGPFIDAAGQMCGSLVILGVQTRAEAEAWAEADPYAKAGLFQSVMIQEWKRVIG